MASYMWYDVAGRQRRLSKAQVSALVRKYGLKRRRIYGALAVDSDEWDALMDRLGVPLAPGYKIMAPPARQGGQAAA